MLIRIILLSLCLLIAGAPLLAQEEAFLGKWDINPTDPPGNYAYWLEVKKENGVLSGNFLNRGGSVLPLPEITVENGELVFSPAPGRRDEPKPVHRAKVVGGKLVGTVTEGAQVTHWVGVRPPHWGNYDANGKLKFGKPVELFDGKDMSHWRVQYPDKASGWTVQDGAMTNTPPANNLVSNEKFRNFKIHAEYKLTEHSNSGIYLRGRYELQVLDDYGKPPESHGHMAIYSRVPPLVNASKPVGEWQTMEATLVGNRVTVLLNGQVVHSNVAIEGITGGALDANEGDPGPIMLQGDHEKVWYRRVTVTPVK